MQMVFLYSKTQHQNTGNIYATIQVAAILVQNIDMQTTFLSKKHSNIKTHS